MADPAKKLTGPTAPNGSNAALITADGAVFFGRGVGAEGETIGEICFNTSMTGYQEILTDPSYAGQIITFTFPHIGNVGCNEEDIEAQAPAARGLILRECITAPSNFRSNIDFDTWLKKNKLTGICGVDTRALTRAMRTNGVQNVMIVHGDISKLDVKKKLAELKSAPDMEGMELAKEVTRKKSAEWKETPWALGEGFGKNKGKGPHVVAIDYGAKCNILRLLAEHAHVTVVPADTSAKEIFALKPEGVFLSNGPGDPAATGQYALPIIKELLEKQIPIFGICLGHQLLGLALGAKTEKMHQGHRGANHPIQDLKTKKVFITSQNHGFVVSDKNLPKDVEVTHRSLFDKTVQGIRSKKYPAFSVQGHPEASPGPHDTHQFFGEFIKVISDQSSVVREKR